MVEEDFNRSAAACILFDEIFTYNRENDNDFSSFVEQNAVEILGIFDFLK